MYSAYVIMCKDKMGIVKPYGVAPVSEKKANKILNELNDRARTSTYWKLRVQCYYEPKGTKDTLLAKENWNNNPSEG